MESTPRPGSNRLPVLQGVALRPDGKRIKIHPAEAKGRFTRLQQYLYPVLIVVYAAMPWIKVGGHPLIFVDIEHRRFFLFGLTFNSTDFYLAFFALSGIGFGLIVLSALYGRVWCGYACPQTVFLDGVFRKIEALVEGRARERAARDQGPWTAGRVGRLAVKHSIYLVSALIISHIFLSYFATVAQVLAMVRRPPQENWGAFLWIAITTALIYFNFAWFREQLCVVICPYGRLQSVLADPDTIVVGYDHLRGEPRGKKGTPGARDCVDCRRCVQVCPTGIDIRQGLQLECIGCAHCIDACDEVMVKTGRPIGLIRYDSARGLGHEAHRFWRPRVFGYLAAMLAGALAFTLALTIRRPFDAALLRAQQVPYERMGTNVVNRFVLHVTSKSDVSQKMKLTFDLPPNAHVIGPQELVLGPFESTQVPLVIEADASHPLGPRPVVIHVANAENGHEEQARSTLLGL